MLKTYITIAIRNFWRHRRFSVINVLSLAMSLSVLLLLSLLLFDQWKIDRHHPDAEQIYRVLVGIQMGNKLVDTPAPLGVSLREDFPGVEAAARLRRAEGVALSDKARFQYRGFYTEPEFFELFGWTIQDGVEAKVLSEPNQILLSEEWAEKLFGDSDPVGQLLDVEDKGTFMIAGVINQSEGRSHLSFDLLISLASLEEQEAGLTNWDSLLFLNYLRLEPGVTPDHLSGAFAQLRKQHYPNADERGPDYYNFSLQPVTGIALGPMVINDIPSGVLGKNGFIILSILALLILLITCFTFTNLSLARAFERHVEVGIRKTVGARRWQIIMQLLIESVVLAFVALAIALIALPFLIRGFNSLIFMNSLEIGLSYNLINDPAVLLIAIVVTVTLGIIAGFYPAIILSSSSPVQVITGRALGTNQRPAGRARLRQVLLGVQLCMSFVLIISTLLLYRQADYMLNADYGFDIEEIIHVSVSDVPYEILKQDMLAKPGVEFVTGISKLPSYNTIPGTFVSDEQSEGIKIYELFGAVDFLSVLGIDLLAGEPFSSVDSGVIINEEAARALGFNSPIAAIGNHINRVDDSESFYTISGVTKDFHYGFDYSSHEPVVLFNDTERIRHTLIRAEPSQHQALLKYLETYIPLLGTSNSHLWTGTMTDVLNDHVSQFKDVFHLIGFTGMFTLFITIMGIFGMAAYSMQARTKEMGIRKVLGAPVTNIAALLSKEFLIIAGISITIGSTIAWYINSMWLEYMPNRIAIGSGVFIIGFCLILFLLAITVGWQSYQIATHNPVNSLRDE